MTSSLNKTCVAYYFVDLLFYTFLLIIRRFLVKRIFYQQFVESEKLVNLHLRQGSF